jgi:nucleotide-binding universal stress UspA family protein
MTGLSQPSATLDKNAIYAASSDLEASNESGLTTNEARRRLEQYGPNILEEKHIGFLSRLFTFFWGPIPWMIEIAAILSGAVRHLEDFVIILAMLLINAGVGFWEEFKADNAIEALKQHLALRAPGINCWAIVEGGVAYKAIVDTAKRIKASLIVISTHGRTGLAHVLIGSVAERVVQHSACPVLTIRTLGNEETTDQ